MKNKKFKIALVGFLGVLGVVIGAFGAHYLKERIGPNSLISFKTGVNYHFYHTLAALLVIVLSNQYEKVDFKWTYWFFIVGIFCFSGSIYLLATRDIHQLEIANIVGPITPIGGLFFMLGWISLIWTFYRSNEVI